MKKKVVIFGGSGFLGSHTADELTSNNFKVTIFDKNPSSFLKKNQDFIQGDIFDNNKINKVLKNKDYVYNFVALSNLEQSLKDPISTIDINLKSCINLLILSKKNNIKKFIFSSTFYVGGDYGGFYRCSKSASEDYIKDFYRCYGLKYSILRFGSLYGPRSDYNNGIYNILKNAIKSKKIIYEGYSDSQREYIHIFDAARICAKILNPEFDNKILNITGKETVLISDLLKIIKDILKIKQKIIYKKKNFFKIQTHYRRTPFTINKDDTDVYKYSDNFSVDLGQGLANLAKDIFKNKK